MLILPTSISSPGRRIFLEVGQSIILQNQDGCHFQAKAAEDEIKSNYGEDVSARMNFSINESVNQTKNPMEDGMLGINYNSGVNFSVSVQPTRQGRVAPAKKVLEELTKK